MTSAIDIKRYRTMYRTHAMTLDGARNCSRQVILKVLSFHFLQPAHKNGHPVCSRFLSRIFVITISSHLFQNFKNITQNLTGFAIS